MEREKPVNTRFSYSIIITHGTGFKVYIVKSA